MKYKWSSDDWNRADLYQAVAFAVAFHTRATALVGFRSSAPPMPKRVQVGEIEVQELYWLAEANLLPAREAERLAVSVERWLEVSLERITNDETSATERRTPSSRP